MKVTVKRSPLENITEVKDYNVVPNHANNITGLPTRVKQRMDPVMYAAAEDAEHSDKNFKEVMAKLREGSVEVPAVKSSKITVNNIYTKPAFEEGFKRSKHLVEAEIEDGAEDAGVEDVDAEEGTNNPLKRERNEKHYDLLKSRTVKIDGEDRILAWYTERETPRSGSVILLDKKKGDPKPVEIDSSLQRMLESSQVSFTYFSFTLNGEKLASEFYDTFSSIEDARKPKFKDHARIHNPKTIDKALKEDSSNTVLNAVMCRLSAGEPFTVAAEKIFFHNESNCLKPCTPKFGTVTRDGNRTEPFTDDELDPKALRYNEDTVSIDTDIYSTSNKEREYDGEYTIKIQLPRADRDELAVAVAELFEFAYHFEAGSNGSEKTIVMYLPADTKSMQVKEYLTDIRKTLKDAQTW